MEYLEGTFVPQTADVSFCLIELSGERRGKESFCFAVPLFFYSFLFVSSLFLYNYELSNSYLCESV